MRREACVFRAILPRQLGSHGSAAMVMNDNTNEQPQGAEISSTAAAAPVVEATAVPSSNSPATTAPAARRAERRERPGKASLADASGADALMALARQMRLARGEPEEAPQDGVAAKPARQERSEQRRPVRAANSASNGRPAGNKVRSSNRLGAQSRVRQGKPVGEAANASVDAQQPVRTPRPLHPVLVQLGQLYPKVFGEQPLPLKRGVYQDLVAAHPADLDAAGLKVALGLHTRSYRYLNVVSQGVSRHDLQGVEVEVMAPEHVHHALLEVFRRRKPRDGEDVALKLRRRIAIAFDASGLTRESYALLVRGRNAEANLALDDALAEVAERDAKAEALRRAFEASGKDDASFAEMYGVRQQAVQQALKRCKQIAQRTVREVVEPAAAAQVPESVVDAAVAMPISASDEA